MRLKQCISLGIALFLAVCTASNERAESHSGLGLQPLIRDLLRERDQDIASQTSLNGPSAAASIVDGWSTKPLLKRHRRQWSPSSVVQGEYGSAGDVHGATHRKSLALQRADNLGADDLDEIELRDAASMESELAHDTSQKGQEPAEPEVGPNPGEVPSALATKGSGHKREVQEGEKQEEEKLEEEKHEEEKQEEEKQEQEQEAEPEPQPQVQGQDDGQATPDKTDEKPEEESPSKQTEESVDSEEEEKSRQRAKRRAEEQREERKQEMEQAIDQESEYDKNVGNWERHRVEKLQDRIEKQTDSDGLAEMLGSMKLDMYILNERISSLQRDIKDGVRLEPPDPDKSMVYPVSICVWCILALVALYVFVYTALAVCKIFVALFEFGDNTKCELALRAACDTVLYAPMLCVLFLGAEMRALQITRWKGELFGIAELAMEACTWSVFVQTLLVLTIPLLLGEVKSDSRASLEPTDTGSQAIAGLLTCIRYACMAVLYLGLVVVSISVFLMDARNLGTEPEDLWDDPTTAATEYAPPVSNVMRCTIALAVIFFFICLAYAIIHSCLELVGDVPLLVEHHKGVAACLVRWERTFRTCVSNVSLSPMLCVLFIAARMRALQIEPKWGKPQGWAEACMFTCVTALVINVVIVILAQLFGVDPFERYIRTSAFESTLGRGLTSPRRTSGLPDVGESRMGNIVFIAHCVSVMMTYMCCLGVILSILIKRAPGGEQTPPLSPTLCCVVFLSIMYFALFLVFALSKTCTTSSTSYAQDEQMLHASYGLKIVEYTLKLCPMVAILFVTARIRALHVSHQHGSPQCWAQNSMYAVVLALSVQVALAVMGTLSSSKFRQQSKADDEKDEGFSGRILFGTLQALAVISLHCSVLVVVASVLMIRPEAAGCGRPA